MSKLRIEGYKPTDAILVAVSEIPYERSRRLTELVFDRAETYHFRRLNESDRNNVFAASEIEDVLEKSTTTKTTFQ
ncbi:hypothetical protein SAMN05421809_2453 [Natronorubrum daqingense]|uniref:Uncharacterized protein n=1 Tax=Natronorubrum daqingense TaxID=588898 RepID=A0A1N7E4W4_9EURY|nr:hypothetical protein SAMN05421809_2453 [Natronorubrum daqingense]